MDQTKIDPDTMMDNKKVEVIDEEAETLLIEVILFEDNSSGSNMVSFPKTSVPFPRKSDSSRSIALAAVTLSISWIVSANSPFPVFME